MPRTTLKYGQIAGLARVNALISPLTMYERPATAEFALLLACIGWPLDDARLEAIRAAAAAPLDWRLVLRLVERHRLAGLVNHALTLAGAALPAFAADHLSDRGKGLAQHELLCASETIRLHGALQSAGFQPLALKGVALAMRAYGRLGLRYNHDIDILVPAHQRIECAELLRGLGYRAAGGASAVEQITQRAHRYKDILLEREDGRHIVELHWRLFDNESALPALDPFAAPAQVNITPSHAVAALPAEAELIYLFRHGAEHAWSRLKWLADANALMNALGWRTVRDAYGMSQAHGAQRAFDSALLLCSHLLGSAPPQDLLSRARRSWHARALTGAAVRAIAHSGATEIENTHFETTRKNASHYLLSGRPAFWWRELVFDLTTMPASASPAMPFSPAHRLSQWFARHARPTGDAPRAP